MQSERTGACDNLDVSRHHQLCEAYLITAGTPSDGIHCVDYECSMRPSWEHFDYDLPRCASVG